MTGGALDAGLARERTSLSWSRTALALTGNGVLVLVRHENAFPLPVAAALAGLSLATASLALTLSALRSRVARQAERDIAPPTALVASLGAGVTVLNLATGFALVGWG